ncbi:hypothetical protein B9Z65_553 [Elsinoe australis]|uniref:2,5-diamino-6-ribosylamino-4(3H)-pyrimidinone 5'-phosphate reductase n=1 Tax=Elsinoe australis TaxID=40998 RepID=A0A2P8AIU8_9PEZI|nr:hypothetical protein B9Z65_553 [Elsinoe australis]
MANRDALEFPNRDRDWLENYLPSTGDRARESTPFVTLTFATSLDSALAISPGVQTALSGPQSKSMTHFLRSRHDAILVGVGTATADNPSLNCRLRGTGGYGGTGLEGQPRPVVIDPHCRWAFDEQTKVIQLANSGRGRAPLIVARSEPSRDRAAVLHKAGGEYIKMSDDAGEISWSSILAQLHSKGIKSIMIEGGAKVINALLSPKEAHLVDSVIVTIAPTWLGPDGLKVCPQRADHGEEGKVPVARLVSPTWHQLGDDVVLCGHINERLDAD